MATDNQRLRFSYQPIVDRATRSARWVEALVSLEREQGDPIAYRDLASQDPSVEETLMRTAFVLDRALADLPRLRRMFGPKCGLTLSISHTEACEQLRLVPLVRKALADHKLTGSDLQIVVATATDSGFAPALVQTFEALQGEHVKVGLDCCGNRPRPIPKIFFDSVKLDPAVVRRMLVHSPTRSLVTAMAAFCDDAAIEFIANGVDDAMILNELEPLPCPQVQGTLFGDAVEMDALLPPIFQPITRPELVVDVRTMSSTSQAQLDDLRCRIEDLDARTFGLEWSDFLTQAENLMQQLAELPSTSARELACILGEQVALAAVFANEKITALDWGLETSNLAEELGQFGVSAQMLALISTVPVSTESSRFVRVEALSRALQIRATTALDPEASGVLDNSLALTFAHLGLTDRATSWWNNVVSDHEDLDLRGNSYAAVNLAEIYLAALEDPEYSASEVERLRAHRRIERATSRLERSAYAGPGLVEAFRTRQAVLAGNVDLAFQSIEPWLVENPVGIVSRLIVTRARAALARATGDTDGFLQHTSILVEQAVSSELVRHHRTQAMILRIDALTQAGHITEALATQRALIDHEIDRSERQSSGMFDWLQIRADVDLQYAHYAGVARVPQAAAVDG